MNVKLLLCLPILCACMVLALSESVLALESLTVTLPDQTSKKLATFSIDPSSKTKGTKSVTIKNTLIPKSATRQAEPYQKVKQLKVDLGKKTKVLEGKHKEKPFSNGKPNTDLTLKEIKKHFKQTYKDIKRIEVTAMDDTDRLLRLWLRGDFLPVPNPTATTSSWASHYDDETVKRASVIAQDFLTQEAVYLGAASPRNIGIATGPVPKVSPSGHVNFSYQVRFGKIQVEGSAIHISINPNERISSVSATIVPPFAEMVAAIERDDETITEDAVREVVKNDLDERLIKYILPEKIIRHQAPYLVWKTKVYGRSGSTLIYMIDSFTGEILSKESELPVPSIGPGKEKIN